MLGIAQTSDFVALDRKEDITVLPGGADGGRARRIRWPGVGPNDIQFAEVHDCFTIAEIIAIEDLGFVSKGQGGPYTAEGCTALTGARPVNTSGGLKAKGHPVGATGVAQILRSGAADSRRSRRAAGRAA